MKYDDIIDLPHHVSKRHPRMPISARAAQFSPFAALSGYEDAIEETERITEKRRDLDENMKAILDERLTAILSSGDSHAPAEIEYFVPDARKSGGETRVANGRIMKVDRASSSLVLDSGERIPISSITMLRIHDTIEK